MLKTFHTFITICSFIFLLGASGCTPKGQTGEIDFENTAKKEENKVPRIAAPTFNADSAFYFIEKQVGFGFRVPNSAEHEACGDYLIATLKDLGANVVVQELEVRAYNGKLLKGRNIIASINPEAKRKILLAAHWDTRPFADQEPLDSKTRSKPIEGANDGGSGVAVLLEVLRTIQVASTKPEVGLDVILFDLEDYGQPSGISSQNTDTYCLGSQYWGKKPHVAGYSAYYGILLDMVGAENATFHLEGVSMKYAPKVMVNVWNAAHLAGFGSYFIKKEQAPITDDHFYVNKLTNIPMIDIIDYKDGFTSSWHTHKDNIDVISKETLHAVGQTLLEVIYNEPIPVQ
jgi:hypothetical protein